MFGKKINSKQYVFLADVKEILNARLEKNEKGVEPTYEQNLAKEYVKKFVRLSPAKAKKLTEDLKKLSFLDEKTVIKIADIVPEDEETLALLVPSDVTIDEQKKKEILEIVKSYLK
ncbi:MAG: DNA-directed RNA polymerase subunit F [Candidatus Diapherotrites archaeon]|nr:DNA-directed RNA polymerase subunit F [Candidatus Diapherotrites archaeon]